MENELGSDIELIEDENMLREMWQKTEDYRKKKEIRMRMFKLRKRHLKELYTTEDMIQTNATSERSSTNTHTESITDQGFIMKKTKEIKDSQLPSEFYGKKLNTNTNFRVKEVKPKEKSPVKQREHFSVKQLNSLIKEIKPSSEEKDLDNETTFTVADRVSKFFKNVPKKNEEKPKETVKNLKDEKYDTKIIHIDVDDSSENTNIHKPISTRKISRASGYKARKDFFENKNLNNNSDIAIPITTQEIVRSSIINCRASFEVNDDKKTLLNDKTNVPKQTTPNTKHRSHDRIIESPIKIMNTDIFDIRVEKNNKSRRILESKTIKDRKAAFEKIDVAEKPARQHKFTLKSQSPISIINTDRLLEIHNKSSVVPDKPSENVSTRRITSSNIGKKSAEKTKTIDSINNVSDSADGTVSSNSADRNVTETHRNRKKIEEIFDLHVLELMLEKAMCYDQKRRIIAQIRSVKRQLEPTIRGKDTTKSPEPVKKTKSIIKRHIEEPNVNDEKKEIKITHIDVHDSSENTNIHNPISTRKISGASDYISRREFFENKKLNNNSDIAIPITIQQIVRSSIINRRASFEVNDDKKTLLKDKTNVPKQTTPDTKNRSHDRIIESPTNIMNTDLFDIRVEEINKSRRILESKTMKDRKAAFEKIDVAEKPAKPHKFTLKSQSPISVMNTDRLLEMYTKSSVVPDKPSENVSTRRIKGSNIGKKSAEKTKTIDSINNVSDSADGTVSSNSADRNVTETHRNRKKIEEIFDLHVLELMLEKAMCYDQKRRIIAQIRSVKRQLEPTIRGKDTTKSPEPVKKTKSIIKRHIEEPNVNDEKKEIKITHIDVHDSSENTNIHNPISTRKISGASDYISRREFFENKKLNNNSDIAIPITIQQIVRSSIINRRASFEVNDDKKTLLKDKTNVPKQTTPDTKNRSHDRIIESPTNIMNTDLFDIRVEEINKSRRILESKTMKDRKAAFEKIDVAEKPAKPHKFTLKSQSPISVMNTDRLLEMYTKSSVVPDKPSENVSTRRIKGSNIGKKSAEKTKTIDSINNVSDSADGTVSSNSADRNVTETPERSTAKCFEEKPTDSKIDTSRNRNEQYTATETVSVPINTSNVIKSTTVHTANDETQNLLELMLEKAVGYDNRRRLIAQIRKAKLQIEPSNNDKDSKNVVTRSSKTVRDGSPAQPHKQNNSTTLDNVSFFKTRKTIIKTERSISLRESHSTLNSNLQSYSPQNATTRSLPFEESRSMLPQERN